LQREESHALGCFDRGRIVRDRLGRGPQVFRGVQQAPASVLTVVAMAFSLWLLAVAMKTIPVGTAYAVWTGIGAVGVAVLGA